MQFLHLALLTSLSIFAQAAPDWGEPPSRTSCTTEYGKSRLPWHTHWSTYWEPCTTTRTSTRVVIASPSTITHTTIVTEQGPPTTITQSVTVTQISGTIVTASTTYTSTSTVPASAGFVPVQSSLPGSTYSGSGGADPVAKRDTLDHSNLDAQKYVVGVECHVWKPGHCVQTVTTVTSTKQASPTTITVTQHLQTTGTTTLTSTTTTISTSIVTNTPTIVSTVYAACATNNLADYYGTYPIAGASFVSTSGADAGSAYDCCVLALQTPNTQVFVFQSAGDGLPSTCQLLSNPSVVCDGQTSGSYIAWSAGTSLPLAAVGNAYCGEVTSFSIVG
ncbi:hypothetical protein BDY17DRAFT_332177 [Neohortaea acidophila]|uniref:Uncharacterized protein n=1 Tax=Neohortaea acidophila TaxID=245834 RepID=A0A6A6Q3N9_9PEZI|nr:uncharacterized protein BDY17DRAFT_332177 [Neohortaea acidophila]KAF2486892.1 hypothetical protein BDY17DRAFT_332177 [Neohortaea acidophila]